MEEETLRPRQYQQLYKGCIVGGYLSVDKGGNHLSEKHQEEALCKSQNVPNGAERKWGCLSYSSLHSRVWCHSTGMHLCVCYTQPAIAHKTVLWQRVPRYSLGNDKNAHDVWCQNPQFFHKQDTYPLLVEMEISATTQKSVWRFLGKLNIWPAIPVLSSSLKDSVSYQGGICRSLSINSLFTTARKWNQPQCLSTEERMWQIYTMELYKEKRITSHLQENK